MPTPVFELHCVHSHSHGIPAGETGIPNSRFVSDAHLYYSHGAPSSASCGRRRVLLKELNSHCQPTAGCHAFLQIDKWTKPASTLYTAGQKKKRRSWSLNKLHNGRFIEGTIPCRKNM